jgi:hypothetical protein
MTDSPRPDGGSTPLGADPTRDIRLPALADRPPSVVPLEWSGVQPPSPQPPPAQPASPGPASGRAGDGAAATRIRSEDLQTDDLRAPRSASRERTIAFASPEAAVGRPTPTVGRKPRPPRRWPWIVLALLPVLVIVVSGVWWFLLLRAA